MKVNATSSAGTSSVTRASRAGGQSSAFAVEKNSDAHAPAPVAGASSIAAIDAILTLQSVPDPTTGRGKAVKRAESMLDLLDRIRIGLLEGGGPRPVLTQLVQLVRGRSDGFSDPGLRPVLDDIDLRAQVELAKLNEAF